jgi:hypothetical protein
MVAAFLCLVPPVAYAQAAQQAGGPVSERADDAGRVPEQRPGVGSGTEEAGGPAPGVQRGASEGAGTGEPGVAGPVTLEGDPGASGRAAVSVGILAGRPTVSAIRANAPPRIDGRLDDPIWRTAVRITEFVQQRPLEGAPATEQTEVYVAYDSQKIYFGIYAHYSDPKLIRANRVDRDQTGRDDTVQVYFDPFLDQQRAYVFSVNGYGVQSDSILGSGYWGGFAGGFGALGQQPAGGVRGGSAPPPHRAGVRDGDPGPGGRSWDVLFDQQRAYISSFNGYGVPSDSVPGSGLLGGFGPKSPPQNHTSGGGGSGAPGDSSWDALFDSAGTLLEDGWTAEMAIPFKSLRYPARQQGEVHRWGFQIQRDIDSKDESVVWAPISRNVMGMLRQMGVLEGMTNLSTSRNLEFLPTFTAIQAGTLDTKTAAYANLDTKPEGALNLKYGITPNLMLDFTYNPDFSQIESDRPQIEVNQRFPVFYPELRPFFLEGQEIYQIQAPERLTLVHTRTLVDPRYGAKLTGKVGNTSLGFMVADDEAPGKVDDRIDPAYGQTAKIVLGRVRYDLYSESHIGAIFTDRQFLDSYSRVGGLDGVFRFGANHRFRFTAMSSDRRNTAGVPAKAVTHDDEHTALEHAEFADDPVILTDEPPIPAGVRSTGSMLDFNFRKEGRHLIYEVRHNEIHPEFGTDLGFVRRVDQKQSAASVSYRWWPESWLINWEPRVQYERNYDYQGVLQDEGVSGRLNFQFANNINFNVNMNRDMERYRDINFWKTRYNVGGSVNTSRRFGVGAFYWTGDQIRFIENPFLGGDRQLNMFINVRPFSRLQSEINFNTSRFIDVRTDAEVFDVKIVRTRTTYQFTDRLLLRNIMEYDTFEKTLGGNLLVAYRVNAGTVFFVGYDDHYRQGNQIDALLLPTTRLLRTNRAVFTKLQYLFRY